MAKNGLNNDNLFSWVDQNNVSRISKFKSPRRSSFKSRLIRKIIDSCSKKGPTIPSSSYDFKSKKIIDDSKRNKNDHFFKDKNESLTTNKNSIINDKREMTYSTKIKNLKFKKNNVN